MHLSFLKILEWVQKETIGAIRLSDVVVVVLAVKVRRGEKKYSCVGAIEFFIHIDTIWGGYLHPPSKRWAKWLALKWKKNSLHRAPCSSELLEILWLSQIVLLLTVMKLCHVTVAETLTLELTKDKMPFDLMGVLFAVICLYIQSKNTSIYLRMFSKSSHFILLLGSLNDSAKIK